MALAENARRLGVGGVGSEPGAAIDANAVQLSHMIRAIASRRPLIKPSAAAVPPALSAHDAGEYNAFMTLA